MADERTDSAQAGLAEVSPDMTNPKSLEPQIKQFTLQELQRLALLQLLADAGVEDPATFLDENDIDHMASYKSSVLAIAVSGSTPKQPKSASKQPTPRTAPTEAS